MKALYAALLTAQKASHNVQKASTNAFHKFRYVSAEDMITAARAVLHDNGLLFRVAGKRFETIDARPLVTVDYSLTHVETGETLTWQGRYPMQVKKGPNGEIDIDKQLEASNTYELGYALRDLLLVPRSDAETDIDARNDGELAPPPALAIPGEPQKDAPPAPVEDWMDKGVVTPASIKRLGIHLHKIGKKEIIDRSLGEVGSKNFNDLVAAGTDALEQFRTAVLAELGGAK